MKISRRRMLGGVTATAIVAHFGIPIYAVAQDPIDEELVDEFPAFPADRVAEENLAERPATQQLGTETPTDDEIRIAQLVLAASPIGVAPHVVANYFRDVGRGVYDTQFGTPVRHYVRGWPRRYNPVIVNFFRATRTNPLTASGDYTAWCAAFVNWCIARAHSQEAAIELDGFGIMREFSDALLLGTRSASSGSFRCWPNGDPTSFPRPEVGDVVVWALSGSVNACAPGKGHVGFYMGSDAQGRFITLGGNQRDPEINQSAVVQKLIGPRFSRSDGIVDFHSIRSSEILRG